MRSDYLSLNDSFDIRIGLVASGFNQDRDDHRQVLPGRVRRREGDNTVLVGRYLDM
jgi:hypothetical protein